MRVALVAVAFLLVPSLGTSQSLGEAARVQATKRSGPALARAYSDADLPSPLAPAETEEAEEAAAPPVDQAEPEDALRAELDREAQARRAQEDRWRAVSQQARARIEQAQSELEDCLLRGG